MTLFVLAGRASCEWSAFGAEGRQLVAMSEFQIESSRIRTAT